MDHRTDQRRRTKDQGRVLHGSEKRSRLIKDEEKKAAMDELHALLPFEWLRAMFVSMTMDRALAVINIANFIRLLEQSKPGEGSQFRLSSWCEERSAASGSTTESTQRGKKRATLALRPDEKLVKPNSGSLAVREGQQCGVPSGYRERVHSEIQRDCSVTRRLLCPSCPRRRDGVRRSKLRGRTPRRWPLAARRVDKCVVDKY
jgi:hypothetical protein